MKKILIFSTIFLFGFSMMMHPQDPKSRDHNSLGFGVAGDVAILKDSYLVGQTGSSLNNGSVYIYKNNESEKIISENIFSSK